MRFGIQGKLGPRYIGLLDDLEHIGQVACRLALLPHLSSVYDVFHVSLLKEYHPDNSHIVSFREIEFHPDLTYPEDAMKVIDRRVKTLKCKEVPLVWVQWTQQGVEESMRDCGDKIRRRYPKLFEQPVL